MERTCAWCGEPVAYSSGGRPPRYCSAVHRRRGWELRTAQDRAERPVDDGGRNQALVREVVQRTTVLQEAAQAPPAPRPAQRLSGQPYTLPEDAVEWVEALAALRREVTHPQIYPFREQVARACERAAPGAACRCPRTGTAGVWRLVMWGSSRLTGRWWPGPDHEPDHGRGHAPACPVHGWSRACPEGRASLRRRLARRGHVPH